MASAPGSRRRVLTALLLTGLVASVLGLSGCRGPEVPDVTNMKPADAVRVLEDAGFLLGETTMVKNDKVPIGFVAFSTPAAGTRAKKGSKIDLAVNAGTGNEVAVPTLIGSTQETVENTLKGLNLIPVAAQSYSATAAAGIVIAQVPAPGSRVPDGSQVAIQVSKGVAPKKVAVPNVAGKTQSQAESAIKSAGLTAKVFSYYTSSVAKGTVGAQQPKAGTQVVVGTEVSIAVSLGKGVGAVTVPNVTGKKEADAVNAMKAAGLVPKVYRQYSDTVDKGFVGEQLPMGGTTAASGAEVAVVVSLGTSPTPDNVSVPNVTGKTQIEGQSSLEAVGFVVKVVEQPSPTVASGSVVAQLPVAGSTAPAGSTVVISVSTGP